MRNVIYAINATIAGCFGHTQTISDEKVLAYNTQLIRDADLLAFGLKSYQLMIPYWPDVIKDRTRLRQKPRRNLPGRSTPGTRLFFHDH